jgi:hypothetical protein
MDGKPQMCFNSHGLQVVGCKRPMKCHLAIAFLPRLYCRPTSNCAGGVQSPTSSSAIRKSSADFLWNHSTNKWYFITQKRWYFVTHPHIRYSNYLKSDGMLQLSDLAFFLLILLRLISLSNLIPSSIPGSQRGVCDQHLPTFLLIGGDRVPVRTRPLIAGVVGVS